MSVTSSRPPVIHRHFSSLLYHASQCPESWRKLKGNREAVEGCKRCMTKTRRSSAHETITSTYTHDDSIAHSTD